ncbi:hypothetical protein PFISCL1PPCAC_2796, partial [Pristionchus fissidentatus]
GRAFFWCEVEPDGFVDSTESLYVGELIGDEFYWHIENTSGEEPTYEEYVIDFVDSRGDIPILNYIAYDETKIYRFQLNPK